MRKTTCRKLMAALLACLAFGTTAAARTPFTAEMVESPATVDRLPLSLTASSVSLYGWPTSFAVQHTGVIDASYDDYGQFGEGFYNLPNPPNTNTSFETPAGSTVRYLFGGTVWIGGIVGNDTLVSVGADGWYGVREFYPTGDGPYNATIESYPYAGDNTFRGQFTDTLLDYPSPDPFDGPHTPLNIEIANRSMIWRQSPLDNAIVYDMIITNIGDQTIEQGYVGYYFDADVCVDCNTMGFDDDIAGSIRDHGIGYVIDNNGDPIAGLYPEDQTTPKVFAFKLLHTSFTPADTTFNWWVSNGAAELDYGPRMRGTPEDPFRDFGTGGTGTPVGDRNKYYLLSHREWDYDQVFTAIIGPADATWMEPPSNIAADLADGFDARFLMSIGPFDLEPDSSVRVIFTTFTADSIHVDPTNLVNLPNDPFTYEAHLQLDRMPAVTAVVDTLTPHLLDPDLPPLGLKVSEYTWGAATAEWDPWTESTVDGYDIFITPVDPATLPFPGALPPWVVPGSPQLYASVERVRTADLSYPGGQFSAINVAHHFGAQTGQLSRSEFVGVPQPIAPTMPPYTYYYPGTQVAVTWGYTNADHYNVYKFAAGGVLSSSLMYKPFYATEIVADTVFELQDSVNVEGTWYYYYAMTPYAQVPGGASQFSEYVADSAVYIVTAVDQNGFESAFSATTALEAPLRTRGTLVLTNSTGAGLDFGNFAYISAFYDSVLAGEDYTIFNIGDSIGTTPNYNSLDNCPNWIDLMPYETVIIDDRDVDQLPGTNSTGWAAFDRYLESAGRIIYFGSFISGTNVSFTNAPPAWYPVTNSWMNHAFGVDSVYFAGLGYFYVNAYPLVDTMFAFNRAEPISGGFAEVTCDTNAYPIGIHWPSFWPTNTPPLVASFHVADGSAATPTHAYRSLVPAQSLQEGTVVGVTNTEGTWYGQNETYAFGFHLYYMSVLDAKALLNSLRAPNQAPSLALPDVPGYGVKGVNPQRGSDADTYEFRIQFSDPDGDAPYPGYPRVHIVDSAWQEIAGSPFTMTELKEARIDPFTGTYSLQLSSLAPNFYAYWFEARDERAAAAETGGTFQGPIVTGPGGNVLHVATTGSDETGDGSAGNPFATITRAARSAANFDTILVGDGDYDGFYTYGLGLVIKSESGPDAAMFDGGSLPWTLYRVAQFGMLEDSSSVLEGFAIKNITSVGPGGSAIWIQSASPVFRNCRFENNASPYGAAVTVYSGEPLFDSCAFIGNVADSVGGAVMCDQASQPRFRNCTFVRNSAPGGGAAIRVANNSTPDIEDCIIAYNSGLDAVSCDQTVTLINVDCTNIYGNVGGDWIGCVAFFDGINGNISENPKFCDPVVGEFHLTAASPCAPTNNICTVLMGAYPVDPECLGCCHLRGDADNSGAVNIADLTYIVSAIFQGGLQPLCFEEADVDNSGATNIADLTYLVATLFQGGPLPPPCQ